MEARKVYAGSRLKSCTSSPSCSGKETTRRGSETRSMESTGPGMKDGEGSRVAGDRGVDNRQCQKSAASYRRAARDADTKKDAGKVEFGVTERRARVTSHETPTTTGGEGEGLEKARVVGLALVGGANSFLPGLEQGPRSGARGVIRLRSRGRGQRHQQGKHAIPSPIHARRRRRRGVCAHAAAAPRRCHLGIGNRGCCHLE